MRLSIINKICEFDVEFNDDPIHENVSQPGSDVYPFRATCINTYYNIGRSEGVAKDNHSGCR